MTAMTTLTASTSLPLSTRMTRWCADLFRSARRSAALAELATLDDRLLRDIGLSRVDVDAMRRMW